MLNVIRQGNSGSIRGSIGRASSQRTRRLVLALCSALSGSLLLCAPALASEPVPNITSVIPNHGPPAGGTKVTITGTNFAGATEVHFGSAEAKSFKVQSETEITAVSPPFAGGEDAMPVFVTTPGGTNAYECGEETVGFIYEPIVTSVAPSSGPAAGGTDVTIRGADFTGVVWGKVPLCKLAVPVVQGVDFGSTPATSVKIVSESEITAVARPGTGTVDVTVRDTPSIGSSPIVPGDQFSYVPVPPEAPVTEVCSGPIKGGGGWKVCGTLNPHSNSKVSFFFAYNKGSSCIGGGETPAEAVEGEHVEVSAGLTGLEANTEYAYCLVAENMNGKGRGQTVTFTTPLPKPVVLAESAAGETRTGVQLSGMVEPENGVTYYLFEYGTSTSYGESTGEALVGAKTGEVAVGPASIGGLSPGTTYHYRLVAGNASGVAFGEDETFTTLALTPPLVSTGAASGVSQVGATLSGTVNPRGEHTTYEFQLGQSTGYGTQVFAGAGEGTVAETVTASAGFLAPGVTYHYRIVANNGDGTSYGEDQTFTTPAYPVLAPAVAGTAPGGKATPPPRPLTRAQKLTRALRACHRKYHRHARRTACEREARRRYGPITSRRRKK